MVANGYKDEKTDRFFLLKLYSRALLTCPIYHPFLTPSPCHEIMMEIIHKYI